MAAFDRSDMLRGRLVKLRQRERQLKVFVDSSWKTVTQLCDPMDADFMYVETLNEEQLTYLVEDIGRNMAELRTTLKRIAEIRKELGEE